MAAHKASENVFQASKRKLARAARKEERRHPGSQTVGQCALIYVNSRQAQKTPAWSVASFSLAVAFMSLLSCCAANMPVANAPPERKLGGTVAAPGKVDRSNEIRSLT